MNWYPKNIGETMCPILVLNGLIGLGMVDYPIGNSRHKLFFIVILIIASFFLLATIYYEYVPCVLKKNEILAITLYRVIRFFNTFIAISAIIVGWFNRKRMQLLIENMEMMDEAFECLGLKKNYYRSFKKISCTVVLYCFLISSTFLIGLYVRTELELTFTVNLMCTSIIYWPTLVSTVVDINLIFSLNCIETRFQNINILLQKNCCASSKNTLFEKYQIYCSSMLTNLSSKIDSQATEKSKNLVELMKQIHLELCKLSQKINQIYGIHLTMQMISNFLGLTVSLFNLALLYYMPASPVKLKRSIDIIGWISIFFTRFLHVNIACSRTIAEAKKTGEILQDMKESKRNFLIVKEINQFARQITQRPLTFTTCGFSTLGISFVIRFLGTVITYLVILIQMGREKSMQA